MIVVGTVAYGLGCLLLGFVVGFRAGTGREAK